MTIDQQQSDSKVKSIAIIGGGASGAIALDTFIKEGVFDKITVFERRDKLGGVWVYDENIPELNIKPGSSHLELDPPLPKPVLDDVTGTSLSVRPNQERFHETASYAWMRSNIIEQFMTYSDLKKWPKLDRDGEDTFTNGSYIAQYIDTYFQRHDPKHVVLNTSVEDITKDYNLPNSKFKLTLRTSTDIKNAAGENLDIWYTEEFDAVVVTVGHYHVPYIPQVPGILDVYARYPERIEHSKTFRSVEKYKNKTVVVIGSRSSGADIAKFLAKVTKKTYNSKRSVALKIPSDAVSKPVIERYEITDTGFDVYFEDGTKLSDPDYVIYGTGYQFSYPFLNSLYPNITNGKIVSDLFQHTFYIDDPRLTFIGIPTDAVSFRAFEYQAVLISRFYGGLVGLPDIQTQKEWNKERYAAKGNTRAYHTIGADDALGYMAELTRLGGGISLESQEPSARRFPVFSEDDLDVYKKAKDLLVKFWDEH